MLWVVSESLLAYDAEGRRNELNPDDVADMFVEGRKKAEEGGAYHVFRNRRIIEKLTSEGLDFWIAEYYLGEGYSLHINGERCLSLLPERNPDTSKEPLSIRDDVISIGRLGLFGGAEDLAKGIHNSWAIEMEIIPENIDDYLLSANEATVCDSLGAAIIAAEESGLLWKRLK